MGPVLTWPEHVGPERGLDRRPLPGVGDRRRAPEQAPAHADAVGSDRDGVAGEGGEGLPPLGLCSLAVLTGAVVTGEEVRFHTTDRLGGRAERDELAALGGARVERGDEVEPTSEALRHVDSEAEEGQEHERDRDCDRPGYDPRDPLPLSGPSVRGRACGGFRGRQRGHRQERRPI